MLLERFQNAINYIGLKQDVLAEKIGMSVYDLRNILTKKKKITPEIALKLEEHFNINPCWLIFGRGNMKVDIGFELNKSETKPISNDELVKRINDLSNAVNEIKEKYERR